MARLERPIFIVGCPRSGTTLVRLILDSHPRISCGPETHMLLALARVEKAHRRTARAYGWGEEEWRERLTGVFASLHREFAVARGKERWADKTPAYLGILPFIERAFPDCQVVHMVRNGLDVVASHRKRWGRKSAYAAARQWPEGIALGREAAKRLGAGRYTELRYEELATAPEPTLRQLLEFLGEPWNDAVLEFQRADHGCTSAFVRDTAARVAAGGDLIYASRIGVGTKEVGPVLRTFFRIRARGAMRELGYW